MRCRSTFDFRGAFRTEGFVAFVDHRARRLDLAASVTTAGAGRVSVIVEGEADLVDAFEMACSLGPVDCLVREVSRTDAAEDSR